MRASAAITLLSLLILTACTTPIVNPGPTGGSGSNSATIPVPIVGSGSMTPEKLSYPEVLVKALNGDHNAEFELGAMFHDGDGVDQNYAKAIEWYTKSAKAGNRQAAFNLGMVYKNGDGVTVDLGAAHGWFVRASDAGDVRAAEVLGVMSYTGQGVAQNYDKAFRYFLKAAQGGLAEGQINTAVMYVQVQGVPKQDIVEAYAWLLLAKNQRNDRGTKLFTSLAGKLTEAQKQKGEARAKELQKIVKKSGG